MRRRLQCYFCPRLLVAAGRENRSTGGDMQANSRTLDALFNSQLRYVVPMFQRLYVWQEDPQWRTLWEDVYEKADLQIEGKTTNPHYLGAVIIEGVKPSSPREVKRFLVIDGQQRLTTLQILFCAFRDIARKNGWVTLDRAATRYLENADVDVMEHPDEERFKLWPTTLNRAFFSDIISAGSRELIEKKHPLVRLPRRRRPEPRNEMVNGYVYFHASITAWIKRRAVETGSSEENCAFKLLQSLQQDFCVVEISLSEGDDSQEIFYSLNSQGRPLSQSDLLRSLVFMRAEKEKQNRDEIFDQYWSKFETEFWSQEVGRGGRKYARLDLGLRYFLTVKTGALVDARRVNEEYRRWISVHPPRYPSVKDELADFSRHCDAYMNYELVQDVGLASTDLRRVIRDFDVSTALPLILFLELEANLSSKQLADCLSRVESFLARRLFSGEETKEYNKLFVEIVGSIRSATPENMLHALETKLLSGGGTTRYWPSDEKIIETAISSPVYNELPRSALRLIFERLELAMRTSKSEDHSIPENLQIEHIMPQRWATHWPISGVAIPEQVALYPSMATDEMQQYADRIRSRNSRVHTLGNLTLLNKYLNPAVGNDCFTKKKSEYGHSVLRLNRYFDSLAEWDENTIQERAKVLGKLLCMVWPKPEKPVAEVSSPSVEALTTV